MSLPDVLRTAPLPTVQNMKIRSEVLAPISIDDTSCTFALPKLGVLDANSVLQLGVEVPGDAYFPVQTGIRSMIKKAEFLCGGALIASSDDFNHISSARRVCLETPEARYQKDSVLTGACGDRFAEFADGKLGFRDLVYTDGLTATVDPRLKPTALASTTFLGSLKLSELFPFALRGRQLPLGFIKDTCFLRITWEKQSVAASDNGRVVCKTNAAAWQATTVSKSNCKFVSDHLFFSDEAMAQLKRQIDSDSGLSFTYADEILTTSQCPEFDNPVNGQVTDKLIERELALSGRTVRTLVTLDHYNAALEHPTLGAYTSWVGLMGVQDNYIVNDKRIFDRPIDTPAKHAVQAHIAFGAPVQVPNLEYSWDTDSRKDGNAPFQTSIVALALEGAAFAATAAGDFRGRKFITALDLTTSPQNTLGSGTTIGSKPMRIQRRYKITRGYNQARTLRIFAEVERQCMIRQGIVTCSA